jgi:hypothetical protein
VKARRAASGAWRRRLKNGDEAELLRWVEQSGLDRTVRIIAAFADAAGERGQPDKLDITLLLKIARLLATPPRRTLHAIAVDVARKKPAQHGESLVSKLERDFKRYRHTFMTLAQNSSPCDAEDEGGSKTTEEFRVSARIVGLLPSKIDAYDFLLADAKMVGPDAARQVKTLGRERVEPLLAEAIKRLMRGRGGTPRNFFELIAADLDQYLRALPPPRRARVGRK